MTAILKISRREDFSNGLTAIKATEVINVVNNALKNESLWEALNAAY